MTTVVFGRVRSGPAGGREGVESGFIALGGPNVAVVPDGALLIALPVQRREHFFGELGALFHDAVDEVTVEIVTTERGQTGFGIEHVVKNKLHVTAGSTVFVHRL